MFFIMFCDYYPCDLTTLLHLDKALFHLARKIYSQLKCLDFNFKNGSGN